jgi:hypothetical protein
MLETQIRKALEPLEILQASKDFMLGNFSSTMMLSINACIHDLQFWLKYNSRPEGQDQTSPGGNSISAGTDPAPVDKKRPTHRLYSRPTPTISQSGANEGREDQSHSIQSE